MISGSLICHIPALTKPATRKEYNGVLPRLYEWSSKNVWQPHWPLSCQVCALASPGRPGLSHCRPSPFFASVWRVFPIVQSGVTTFRLIPWSPDLSPGPLSLWHAWIFVRIKGIYTRTWSPLQTTMFERKFKELIRNSIGSDIKDAGAAEAQVCF